MNDTLLGDITGDVRLRLRRTRSRSVDFATAVVTYTPGAGDPDPLTNTVTATGTGADSGVEASDEASCATDITHEPGIDVTKSCPEVAGVGDVDHVRRSPSPTRATRPLEDVTVNDSILGDVSRPSSRARSRSVTSFTAFIDYTVTEQSPDPIHERGDGIGSRCGLRGRGHG